MKGIVEIFFFFFFFNEIREGLVHQVARDMK